MEREREEKVCYNILCTMCFFGRPFLALENVLKILCVYVYHLPPQMQITPLQK